MDEKEWIMEAVAKGTMPTKDNALKAVKKACKIYKDSGYSKEETLLIVKGHYEEMKTIPMWNITEYWINKYWEEM